MTNPTEGFPPYTCQNKESLTHCSYQQEEWLRYKKYAAAGESEWSRSDPYTVLLVLEGEIALTFNGIDRKTIGKSSLVLVARKQLTAFRWKADTAILEFVPPSKIFRFLTSCCTVFRIVCSSVVAANPALQEWIDDLMAEQLLSPTGHPPARRRKFCMRLGDILRAYPPMQVGELLVPFHACSISGEKRCKGKAENSQTKRSSKARSRHGPEERCIQRAPTGRTPVPNE